ncbi:MAG: CRISPR-associated endonuclease Cas2 [Bacteroidales bacterium]|nr:CRISPR-associated endonuclease Cas2 [Bacteroidales bacterium]
MPRKKREELTADDILALIRESGQNPDNKVNDKIESDQDKIENFDLRIKKILSISKDKRKSTNMLFFVMYDIENDKVRVNVSKYLIKMGCFRIQKSIFLGDLEPASCEKIKSDLAEVQACYENNDSILIVPISTDYLRSMKIIGQNIDIDLIMQNKNTLFF